MKIHYYLQNEKGYKIYRSSLDIAEDKKLPSTAVKDTDFPLPEAIENHERCLEDNGWVNIPNYTQTYYSKTNRSNKTYKIGETPDLENYTSFAPLADDPYQVLTEEGWIHDANAEETANKLKTKSEILAQVETDMASGFEFMGHTFTARKQDRSDLMGEILSWQTGSDPVTAWRDKSNTWVELSQQQLMNLANAMKTFYQTKFMESRQAIDALGI